MPSLFKGNGDDPCYYTAHLWRLKRFLCDALVSCACMKLCGYGTECVCHPQVSDILAESTKRACFVLSDILDYTTHPRECSQPIAS